MASEKFLWFSKKDRPQVCVIDKLIWMCCQWNNYCKWPHLSKVVAPIGNCGRRCVAETTETQRTQL